MTDGTGKVLVYAGGFAPVGGVQTFIRNLVITLRGRGTDVRLVCWGARSPLLADISRAGVPVIRRSWRWGCRFGWPDRFLLPLGRAALEAADVVLFGHLQPRVQREVIRLKKLTGKPSAVLVTPYRPAEMWGADPPTEDVLNSFDVIVVQAEAFGQDLRHLGYRGQVRLLPYLPPECRPAAPLPPAQPLHVGFLGRLAPQKNLAYLLEAFARLRSDTDAQLHLFGDGPERARLARLASELGVAEHIRFHGLLRSDQVARAVDTCHLFAFSSTTEGQPLAALEILARGRPVVGTPVGVFPDMLSGATLGRLAPLSDPRQFAQAILSLYHSLLSGDLTPIKLQQAYAARFPREQVLNHYVKLITDLAAPARVPAGAR